MDHLTAYFDGACEWFKGRRNPGGLATFGWLVVQSNMVRAYGFGEAARKDGATNNVAEYAALIHLIKAIKDLDLKNVIIHGDSKLVINQINGVYAVRSESIIPLYHRVMALKKGLSATFVWIPREQNEVADVLSKFAYRCAKVKKTPLQNFRYVADITPDQLKCRLML